METPSLGEKSQPVSMMALASRWACPPVRAVIRSPSSTTSAVHVDRPVGQGVAVQVVVAGQTAALDQLGRWGRGHSPWQMIPLMTFGRANARRFRNVVADGNLLTSSVQRRRSATIPDSTMTAA